MGPGDSVPVKDLMLSYHVLSCLELHLHCSMLFSLLPLKDSFGGNIAEEQFCFLASINTEPNLWDNTVLDTLLALSILTKFARLWVLWQIVSPLIALVHPFKMWIITALPLLILSAWHPFSAESILTIWLSSLSVAF